MPASLRVAFQPRLSWVLLLRLTQPCRSRRVTARVIPLTEMLQATASSFIRIVLSGASESA